MYRGPQGGAAAEKKATIMRGSLLEDCLVWLLCAVTCKMISNCDRRDAIIFIPKLSFRPASCGYQLTECTPPTCSDPISAWRPIAYYCLRSWNICVDIEGRALAARTTTLNFFF